MDSIKEIIAKIDVHQKRMEANMNAWQKETLACQEAAEACLEKVKANPKKMKGGLEEMEAAVDIFKERLDIIDTMDLEANSEEKEVIAEQQDIPTEEAALDVIGALKDRYGDWHLAMRRHGQLTLHAVPAWHKVHSHKGPMVEKR
jgi:hypothetical protein